MNFEKYQHVERLGTSATEGILRGTCFIFPKLDGTNTSVYLNDNGEVEVASRNRVLSIHNDNHGVCNYVHSQTKIKAYLEKFPNRRLFGEWLVPHTIRDYQDDAWHKLYIFDVTEDDKYLNYYDYLKSLLEFNLDFIAMLDIVAKPTIEQLEEYRDHNFYFMKDGKIGEGIVIKNYDFVNQFGKIVWAKLLKKKENPPKKSTLPALEFESVESLIVDSFLTNDLIEKEFSKIAVDGWQSQFIGKLIQTIWYVFITEEIFNAIKKFHNPKVDFKLLNKLAVKKIKRVKPDIFF